jgi:hypothetical protein
MARSFMIMISSISLEARATRLLAGLRRDNPEVAMITSEKC